MYGDFVCLLILWNVSCQDVFASLTCTVNMSSIFPDGSDDKESSCNVGDLASIPGMEKSPGGGHGSPLQHSCLETPHGQRSLAGYSHKESDMID